MQTIYKNIFKKDISNVDKNFKNKLKEILALIENADNIREIKNLKKIEGYSNYYRIRIGDYRLGIEFIDDKIILRRFKHRKDIYKVFP